ncbi:DUF84 family protein [Filibacter tadaridae]|uniref:inosine/xanthosine triphosphatase n=1 Tax=Filibacter tadaridae TaxID=2483811 RepID=A0A3P5WZ43_9BACL|nr:DUF84 family protein [Filibacter tadaridae]VDC26851.1 Non-canonical purine NTP phosphatase [Filibacter tadaridae]
MEFVIGTTNQAKLNAANQVLLTYFPHAVVSNSEVGSGVADQPFGDEETKLGAINRALRSTVMREGVIGIGLEGGVRMIGKQMYMCNWGAIVLPDGTRFTAGGAQIPLPQEIAMEVLAGKELGPVVDDYFQASGIRTKEGAMGMLTAHAVNRKELFVHILQLLAGQYIYHMKME